MFNIGNIALFFINQHCYVGTTRIRAEKIAENSMATIGKLRYSKMGVFQIIAQNSNENYTWGGAFNTPSKTKTATITIKLQFGIKQNKFFGLGVGK